MTGIYWRFIDVLKKYNYDDGITPEIIVRKGK
jgi:hypothetical protein